MLKKTKYFLNLGFLATAVAPILAVVSCDDTKPTDKTDNSQAIQDKANKALKAKKEKKAKEKAIKDAAFKRKYDVAGANIDGPSSVAIIAQIAPNVEEFKTVLLLAGEIAKIDKYSSSGLQSMPTEFVLALYNFYKDAENKDVSLVKTLATLTFKSPQSYNKGKLVTMHHGLGHVMEGFDKTKFKWNNEAVIKLAKTKMTTDLSALVKAKKPIYITAVAEKATTVEEFVEGLKIMGAVTAGDNYSTTGILGLDYYEANALLTFYKGAANGKASLASAVKALATKDFGLSKEGPITNTFPEANFVIENVEDKAKKEAFAKKFKDVIVAGQPTSVSKVALLAGDIKEFYDALVLAGALTINKLNKLGGTELMVPEIGSSLRKKLSGTALLHLYIYLRIGENKDKTIDVALATMPKDKAGDKYSSSSVKKYLTAFPKAKFVYTA